MQNQTNRLHYIEALSRTSINPSLPNHFQAYQQLSHLLFQIALNDFDQMFELYDEIVVLAISGVLLRKVGELKENTMYYIIKVNENLMRWFQPNGTFIRSRGIINDAAIYKTLGQFIGNGLKLLFEDGNYKQFLDSFLDCQQPHYRIFIYYQFIESVSSIDGNTSYVPYRALLRHFEETFIPRIFNALFPFFSSISDAIELRELSFLHNSLSLQDHPNLNPTFSLDFNDNNLFTRLVFELLEQVIAFKYNLSHQDYDEWEEAGRKIISFPDQLLASIINQHFLEALYNVLIQLMRTREQTYQGTCLNCLKKILLAKTTFLSRELETHFIFTNMEGVSSLLHLLRAQHVQNRDNAVNILQCNINFMATFALAHIEEKLTGNETYLTCYNKWLHLSREVPLDLLTGDLNPIDCDNTLFATASEMLASLGNQLKTNQVTHDAGPYLLCYSSYTATFLRLFILDSPILLGSRSFSFDQLKTSSKKLLAHIKVIMTYDYSEMFRHLSDCCDNLFKSQHQPQREYSIGNLLILLQELLRENSTFEESIFGKGLIRGRYREMDEAGEELGIFGMVLVKALSFISSCPLDLPYVNHASILFLATLASRCSCSVSTGEDVQHPLAPFIDYEVYKQMKKYLQMTDEDFLLQCFATLARYIHIQQVGDHRFIFHCLHENILALKYSMRRELFKATKIYKEMLDFFTQLIREPAHDHHIKDRVLLFKIITSLSFDDLSDEYRASIRRAVVFIRGSLEEGQVGRVLYDLTGIFESIEGHAIFKYFLRFFRKEVDFAGLLHRLFQLGPSFRKDVLHLCSTCLKNVTNRLGGHQNLNIYEMLIATLPYWNGVLESEEGAEEEVAMEVFGALLMVVKEGYFNVCLIDHYAPLPFRRLLNNALTAMASQLQTIESAGQLAVLTFDLSKAIVDRLAKILFNSEDPHITSRLHALVGGMMAKMASNFQLIASGTFEQSLLHPMLQIIASYYTFLREQKNKAHLPRLYQNIALATSDNQDKELVLDVLIKIAMDKQHLPQTLKLISDICVNLIDFHGIEALRIVERLGLKDEKDIEECTRIFAHIRERSEDLEWLGLQMKDWLVAKGRFLPVVDSNDY